MSSQQLYDYVCVIVIISIGGVNSGQYTVSPLLVFIFVSVSMTTKMIM